MSKILGIDADAGAAVSHAHSDRVSSQKSPMLSGQWLRGEAHEVMFVKKKEIFYKAQSNEILLRLDVS